MHCSLRFCSISSFQDLRLSPPLTSLKIFWKLQNCKVERLSKLSPAQHFSQISVQDFALPGRRSLRKCENKLDLSLALKEAQADCSWRCTVGLTCTGRTQLCHLYPDSSWCWWCCWCWRCSQLRVDHLSFSLWLPVGHHGGAQWWNFLISWSSNHHCWHYSIYLHEIPWYHDD